MKTDAEPAPECSDGGTFVAELVDMALLADTGTGGWFSMHRDIAFGSLLFLDF